MLLFEHAISMLHVLFVIRCRSAEEFTFNYLFSGGIYLERNVSVITDDEGKKIVLIYDNLTTKKINAHSLVAIISFYLL